MHQLSNTKNIYPIPILAQNSPIWKSNRYFHNYYETNMKTNTNMTTPFLPLSDLHNNVRRDTPQKANS